MSVEVRIPTALRAYTEGRDRVQVEGRTVGEVLRNLSERYGELRRHLYTEEGKLRSFVNLYVNDADFRYLEREGTPVGERDVVSIVPSIAGGSPHAPLSPEELQRYNRHLIMPEVGLEGQERLKASSVLLIGGELSSVTVTPMV